MQNHNEDTINKQAYDLIGRIQVMPEEEPRPSLSGSFEHVPVQDWTGKRVDGPEISRMLHPNLNADKISVKVKGKEYGFTEDDNLTFSEMVRRVQSLPFFRNKVSVKFLEEHSIQWIVNVHLSGQSNSDLINHLRDESDKVIRKTKYYYHVINLHIHKPFSIGNVEFTYFTESFFDEIWASQLKNKTNIEQEDFDKFYRKYQGRVFACFEVTAESEHGKSIAFEECSLATDVLRCFTPTTVLPDHKCYVDLSERININYQTDIISIPSEGEFKFTVSMSARNDPFNLTEEDYGMFQEMGLDRFSEKIRTRDADEISKLIVQSIKLFSYSISTFDLHMRVVQLVTILESLLLEEARKHKMEDSVKRRMNKIFWSPNDNSELDSLLSEMYQVRHKMAHKAIRLPIDMMKLSKFQTGIIETLRRLCELNKTIKDKDSLVAYLDQGK